MGPRRIRLGILILGRGSNMQALLNACRAQDFPAEIAIVLSNKADAGGLAIARDAGIATAVIDHKQFADKPAFENAMDQVLRNHGVELVCLAGFMRILSAGFIDRWTGRIINIHPSLLPDYKGLDTHARALADGRTESGCTVHYVIPEMDAGPIILQRRVPVVAGDTADSLAARILEQEHLAYPEAVRTVADKLKEEVENIPQKIYQKQTLVFQESIMDHHTPVEVDAEQLKHAEMFWGNFIEVSKYSIIAIALLLVFMAIVFVGMSPGH